MVSSALDGENAQRMLVKDSKGLKDSLSFQTKLDFSKMGRNSKEGPEESKQESQDAGNINVSRPHLTEPINIDFDELDQLLEVQQQSKKKSPLTKSQSLPFLPPISEIKS